MPGAALPRVVHPGGQAAGDAADGGRAPSARPGCRPGGGGRSRGRCRARCAAACLGCAKSIPSTTTSLAGAVLRLHATGAPAGCGAARGAPRRRRSPGAGPPPAPPASAGRGCRSGCPPPRRAAAAPSARRRGATSPAFSQRAPAAGVAAAIRPAPSASGRRTSAPPPSGCPARGARAAAARTRPSAAPPARTARRTEGMEEKLTTPPAAFPHRAEALDRTTSISSTAPRSTRSMEVRPSGSVSGTPSCRMRMPRVVPALERSPAPRAPKPRMTMRTSPPPVRDCASTPGTVRSAWSTRLPTASCRSCRPTTVTASGTSRMRAGARVAVTVTVRQPHDGGVGGGGRVARDGRLLRAEAAGAERRDEKETSNPHQEIFATSVRWIECRGRRGVVVTRRTGRAVRCATYDSHGRGVAQSS